MTTAQDLVDAVRPCLPLPNMDIVSVGNRYGEVGFAPDGWVQRGWIAFGWVTCKGRNGRELRPSEVISEILQACVNRGWTIHFDPQDEGGSVTIFYGHIMGRASTTEYVTVHGTDAIALCRAYAAACEAGKGAT